jgi:hypothetical protein
MGDTFAVSIPCLDALESITVHDSPVHLRRLANVESAGSSQGIALLLLHDLRNILSEPNVSEQASLSRLNKLQKRFFSFEELGLSVPNCSSVASKGKHDLPENIIKQLKTSSKANGLWFVTIDAAMKLVFKFCSPQDAIRISLDLSPLLVGSYISFKQDTHVFHFENVYQRLILPKCHQSPPTAKFSRFINLLSPQICLN